MTLTSIIINDKVRLNVKFVDTDPSTGQQVNVSPIQGGVSLIIKDPDNLAVPNTVPTALTSYEYYFDFTPSKAGEYNVTFVGILQDGTYITVTQQIYVNSSSTDYRPTVTLGSDEIISFTTVIEPLYLDPEELLAFFPDASLTEVGELIHHYSTEVKKIFSIEDSNKFPDLSFTAIEYIKASSACELSRTYGFGGDDELSLKLGDLSVTNKSMPRASVNRGNATTWCQIAASLRKELLASQVSMRGVQPKGLPSGIGTKTSGKQIDPDTGLVIYLSDRELYGPGRKGSAVDDPMPKRGLRSRD